MTVSWCLKDAKNRVHLGIHGRPAPIWLPQACYTVTSVSYNWGRVKSYLKGDMYKLILNLNHSDGEFAL